MHRIAVVGAECVGKTTLCQALAGQLPGHWLAEYLREFCDRAGRTPTPGEQPHILHTQILLEARAQQHAAGQGLRWLLCDSAPIATALYSWILFQDHSLIEPALRHHAHYRATLLLEPDLPWTADGIQRDGPQMRERFHQEMAARLQAAGIGFQRIGGAGALREQRAREALGAA